MNDPILEGGGGPVQKGLLVSSNQNRVHGSIPPDYLEATMKKILVLCAAMALVASTAFAVGIDLTAVACGNNPGFTNDAGAIDCAAGGSVTLLAVFQPAEAYNDVANGYVLTGIDGILDMQVAGVLSTTGSAAFWDWDQVDGCNTAAFSANRKAPTTGCTGYTNTFN